MPMNRKLVKIFEFALSQEKTGLAFFQSSLKRMGIGAAVSAFKRLIEEEEKHIAFITDILCRLEEDSELVLPDTDEANSEVGDFFDERARSEFLEQCLEGSMTPDVTVFNTAWLIEKDLSEFYSKMASQTDGKAKEALLMLSQWEKKHEEFLKESLESFDEKRYGCN